MTNEPDLYPPDIEVITPAARDARNRAMIGTFLVTMGIGLMLERTFSNDLDTFWLAVGLSLIVGWTRAPRFLMFAVGSIMTGFGAASFVESMFSIPFDETIANLIIAAGFGAVYVRYPHRARWALVPAGVCVLIAVAAAGIAFIGLIPSAITTLMLPLLLVAGGVLLLTRNALPPRIVRIGLVAIAITFVASVMSTAGDWDGPRPHVGFPGPLSLSEFTTAVPDLNGRTLSVETGSGAIEVITGDSSIVEVTARARHLRGPGISVDTRDDDEVKVSVDRDDVSWVVRAPEGTDLKLVTESGLVKATVDGGDVAIETESGPVIATLRGLEGTLDASTDSGPLQLNARSKALTIDADSDSGPVVVDGTPYADHSYENENGGPTVKLDTDSGPIIVNLGDAA